MMLEQVWTDAKVTKCMMGEPPAPKSKKWREYDNKLETIINRYDDYKPLDFLQIIGHLLD